MACWSGACAQYRSGNTGLLGRVTPVHRQRNARDVVRGTAGKEDRRPSEFVWLPPAPVWNPYGDGVITLWRGRGREVRVNPPWENRIDLNIVLGPEHRQALGELHYPAFGRRIGRRNAATENRRHGADVDDFAPTRLTHVWVDCTGTQEDPSEVGMQHLLPLLQRVILRRLADIDTGVIDQNIDAAKCLDSRFYHGLH